MIARDNFGYPLELRRQRAIEYAAKAKERNKVECQCDSCVQIAKLDAVQGAIGQRQGGISCHA